MDNEKILKIDQLIKQSMVKGNIERDENRTATLRLIKAKYLEFLPKEPTEAEILSKLDDIFVGDKIDPVMKNMGMLIKKVKEAFPVADGKKVSDLVKSRLS